MFNKFPISKRGGRNHLISATSLARQKGFEPPAFPLGGGRSIQLSYWRI